MVSDIGFCGVPYEPGSSTTTAPAGAEATVLARSQGAALVQLVPLPAGATYIVPPDPANAGAIIGGATSPTPAIPVIVTTSAACLVCRPDPIRMAGP